MIAFDYSGGVIPPSALAAAGCQLVCRYVSQPGQAKNISPAEYAELTAAGIEVALVYETTADWALGGYAAGLAAARSARAQATAVGYPPGRQIWYAVDFEAAGGQLPTVVDCLHGCADAEGTPALVSVYGDDQVVTAAAAAGFGRTPWQTVAWSAGAWSPLAALRQTGQSLTIGGVQVDVNDVVINPFQQLPQEDSMPYLISVSPDPTIPNATPQDAGIFLVDGGSVAHVDPASDSALQQRFGTPVAVSPAFYATLLAAAPATSVASVPTAAIAADVVADEGAALTAAKPAQ